MTRVTSNRSATPAHITGHSSRTLFVRDSLTHSLRAEDVHVTSNDELRNNVRLLLNVDLRNYVISRQIVILIVVMLPVDTTMAVMCHVLFCLFACSLVAQDADATTACSSAVSTHVGVL